MLPESLKPEPVRRAAFPIRRRGDVVVAGSQAGRLARGWGLDRKRATELSIVVSELASNIVKHGVQGEIVLTLHAPGGEITVEARDVGPPIRDLDVAMLDGH